MVVDSIIGKVASVTPSITPSQISVAVGGVRATTLHCSVIVLSGS